VAQLETGGKLSATEACAMSVNTRKGLARFEAFELDLRAGELRKDGAKPVRLPEQPFLILTMLLEHPGAVVNARGNPQATVAERYDCGVRTQYQRCHESFAPGPGRLG
jgi:DNA-binding response OmpR family regulator